MTLRFSIVVPTLNRRTMLLQALGSIEAQKWPEVEVIVVDGGSVDGTVEEMAGRHDIRFLMGPDQGVYDAFNKGIAHATGDVVAILNSDDLYEPGAFAAVSEAFAAEPTADCVCGSSIVFDGLRVVAKHDCEAGIRLPTPRAALIGSCTPNARFFRRHAMARIGPFSLNYRYVSDRDWLMRWYEAGLKTIPIPILVYRYRQHDGSLTFRAARPNEPAIRSELLVLARDWRDHPSASSETKRIATFLEGRCIAALAATAIRAGRITDAARLLFVDRDRSSLTPFMAVARGGIDWFLKSLMRQRTTAPP